MTKITNVTPEEREQAISTIEKVGEQVTDERIEYYVQLRRNTIKHQEEKASKEAVNQITEQNKEFAKKVLSYLGRSKSDRQIVLYSKKHLETLSYIKENNLDVDYPPSLFGEAIRFMEEQKSTTIHHLTAEDLANCLKEKKEELINNRNKREEIQKEWRSNTKKEKNEDVVRKAKLLRNIAFCVGVILVLAPFFITGFGFGWFWYLIIIGVAFFCLSLLGTDGKEKGDYSDAKIILIGFCIVGCIMFVWGPLNSDYEVSGDDSDSYRYEQSSSREDSNKTPSWIQGTWYCVTPYGNMQVEIVGDHIREIPGDGSSYYGTYHIQGDAIMPETGSQMYYQMDFDKKRLSAGQGYYFRKQ